MDTADRCEVLAARLCNTQRRIRGVATFVIANSLRPEELSGRPSLHLKFVLIIFTVLSSFSEEFGHYNDIIIENNSGSDTSF